MAAKASCQVTIADITDAYSVVLTSETYTFMGNTSGAPIGSACTTQAIAYQGDTQCSKVTIGTISCPTGISASVSNNGMASPTITFKTTAVISTACEASVPVIIDGITIYKKFSFAVANQGAGFGWNLVRNSKLSDGTKHIVAEDVTINVVDDSAYGKALSVIPVSGKRIYWNVEKVWVANTTYTVSFIAKASVAGQKIRPSRSLADYGEDISLSTVYKQYTTQIVSTATVDGGTLSFSFSNASGDIAITNVKLEKGMKATEWTPHPDDLIGDTGKGIKSTAITYQASASGTTVPTGTWSGSIPTVSAGQYLWVRTIFSYSDNTTSTIYSVSRMGANGATGSNGKSIGSVVNYYLATASSSGVTVATSGWTTAVQSVSASKKYLWNYEVVKYTDGTTASTTAPCIIGTYGDTGAKGDKGDTGGTGNGIKSITEHYAVSTSSSSAPTSWSTTVPTMTESNKYLWNYETITYTNNTTNDTAKRVIGVYGNKGATGSKGDTGATGSAALQIKRNFGGTYTTVGQTATTGTGDFNRTPVAGDAFICMDGSSNIGTWLVSAVSGTTATIKLLAYVSSKGATGAKGDKGDTGATGPQGPQGAKGESDIKCYKLTGGSNHRVWSKLGTLTSAGDNSNFIINIYTGNGYNGNANQNSQAEIVIKDGYQSTASTTSAFGVSVTRQNCEGLKVQVRATASNKCDVWVYLPWLYSWGTYTTAGSYSSWTVASTTQTTEPTSGTLQNIEYRMNPENAAKVATNFMEFTSGTGLQVGNKTNGSWSGYRTKISASAFEILNQAGTTLAYYGDKLIQLGKNAKDAVIELCGGVGKILVETKSGNAALSIQSEYVDIKGVHESVLETSSSSGSCIAGAVDDSFVVNTYSDANNKANFDIGNGSIILESKKKGYQAEVEFYGCGWSGGVYTGAFAPTKAYSEKIMLGDSGRVWERLIVKNSPQVTSDRRAKTNIFPLGESKINKTDIHSELFDRLKPVQYRMIDGDGRICYGFVAQDVVEAMRELGIREDELDLVHHDRKNTEDGYIDTYSMVYTNLIAVITHELQLEKERRSNLEIEVADLRSELESMRDNISGDTN